MISLGDPLLITISGLCTVRYDRRQLLLNCMPNDLSL